MKTQSLEQKKVFSLFGANGATMQEIKPMRLPMYCKVYYFGYGHEGTELAVISDTKPIKDQLKEIGGKFNFRLSCGAGWIFSKKQLPEVEKLLSGL